MERQVIDFSDLQGHVLVGRPRGESLRAAFGLDRIDESQAPVTIKIPSRIQAITASFIGGLFSPSIQRAATRSEFFNRFRFEFDGGEEKQRVFMSVIEREVNRVLSSGKPLVVGLQ